MNKLYIFFMMLATLAMAVPAFAGQAAPAPSTVSNELQPTKKELKAQKKEMRKAVRKAIFKKKKGKKAIDELLKKSLIWLAISVGISILGTLASLILGPLGLIFYIASFIAGCIAVYYFIKWIIEEA